ncbi:Ribonuclease H2 subunit C [Thoreauomyces humboldtii]|nr:Ribonuclease H2 subunit C [Thoreauomyces humboldtii]
MTRPTTDAKEHIHVAPPRDNDANLPTPSLHLLPCKIHHTGPARVSSFFVPSSSSSCEDNAKLTASFRGRGLQGVKVSVPDGYEGVIYRESGMHKVSEEGGEASSLRSMRREGKFDGFVAWGHDEVPGVGGGHDGVGLVAWLEIADDHPKTALIPHPSIRNKK